MTDLIELIGRFAELQILVAGDPMWDFYHFGHVDRISPEAPVPVFLEERLERRAGGAANVSNQLYELGCGVQEWFPPKPWTEKHRYIVGHHQIMRADRDVNYEELTERDQVPSGRWHADGIVISDYAKGFVTRQRVMYLVELAVKSTNGPIVVDPKGTDWTKYVGCDVICPNEAEWGAVNCTQPIGVAIVAKHGSKGISLVRRTEKESRAALFPATAKHVFDVTGAGDTVTAVVAATLAAKGTLEQACILANLAAGYVVGEVGTTVCPAAKLRELIHATV